MTRAGADRSATIAPCVVEWRPPPPGRRIFRAFTLMEASIALALIAAAMMLVVQLALWSMQHRAQSAAHATAIELAANLLEIARATPWESLDDAWAAALPIPPHAAELLPDATLAVHVAPSESAPDIKRVAVAIRWTAGDGVAARPVQLVGWIHRGAVPSEPQP